MKKRSSFNKKERRAIMLGHLWRWGSIALILLVPAIAYGICNLLNTGTETQGVVTFLSLGITMFCVGVYNIIGTALEFKHVFVSLQLASRHIPFQNINPSRGWTKYEKRDYIFVGIIFAVFGLAVITISTLIHFGILS